jgi:imidazoleglycerol-phosphate dehydratase
MVNPSSLFSIQNLVVVNEGKAGVPIRTGVGYLDHMLDQLNSHAQVGVGLSVLFQDEPVVTEDPNRLASILETQSDLFAAVGARFGAALKTNCLDTRPPPNGDSTMTPPTHYRFCCPLDEALVECELSNNSVGGGGTLVEYNLAPYGLYPAKIGRTRIGHLQTAALVDFWTAVAETSGLDITLRKHRGDNGHHIVESSFKAFSRALRNLLDAPTLWNADGANARASVELLREGKIERATKETSIRVLLRLNGSSDDTKVDTGIPALDEFFTLLAQEAGMTLQISCQGDLWVDDHHSAEDVSIAVGQCLDQALGTKAGLNRMWVADATTTSGSSLVEVTMDLSNRPCLRHNLDAVLEQAEYVDATDEENNTNGKKKNRLSCEMFVHVLDSLVMNGRMTVHIVNRTTDTKSENSVAETVNCTAMAFGRALKICAMVDCRRAGQTASSKGTLSV